MKKIILALIALCLASVSHSAQYNFTPDAVTTVENISASGVAIGKGKTVAKAPLDVNGAIKLKVYTKAQLLAFVPGVNVSSGAIIGYCGNCSSTTIAISTGNAAGAVSDIVSRTQAVN